MMSDLVVKYMSKVQEEMKALSEDAMLYPKPDAFEHGVMVGRYQGMREALQLMIVALKDLDDEDK